MHKLFERVDRCKPEIHLPDLGDFPSAIASGCLLNAQKMSKTSVFSLFLVITLKAIGAILTIDSNIGPYRSFFSAPGNVFSAICHVKPHYWPINASVSR